MSCMTGLDSRSAKKELAFQSIISRTEVNVAMLLPKLVYPSGS